MEHSDAMAKEYTTANFQSEVIDSEVPVLVDFWASWCGPCKMITPIIEDLATDVGDSFGVGKVNVDDNQELAQQYGIRSIPTLLFFKGGEIVDQIVGASVTKDSLKEKLQSL